jgi:hypothetical protein
MRRPNPFGTLAAACAALLVVGSVLYWSIALTFGLISGLVVLMAPVYPLLLQAVFTTMVASLCLWRGRPWLALVLGVPLVVLPQLVVLCWYGWELYACQVAPDPDACFAYLNGSPLLPLGVGIYALTAGVELCMLVVFVLAARRFFADPSVPMSS